MVTPFLQKKKTHTICMSNIEYLEHVLQGAAE